MTSLVILVILPAVLTVSVLSLAAWALHGLGFTPGKALIPTVKDEHGNTAESGSCDGAAMCPGAVGAVMRTMANEYSRENAAIEPICQTP